MIGFTSLIDYLKQLRQLDANINEQITNIGLFYNTLITTCNKRCVIDTLQVCKHKLGGPELVGWNKCDHYRNWNLRNCLFTEL